MSFAEVTTKKFLNADGVGHLWSKIKEHYDDKLDNVVATDDSIAITGNNSIAAKISTESDNILQVKTTGNKGLYVPAPAAADTYAVVKSASSGDYAAIYQLMKYTGGTGAGTQVGVDINIPKDMVVESGTVEVKSEAGTWGPAGTYIHLVLANAEEDDLYINVTDLIEYVTSGSQQGDMVVINIDSQHQVTATITDDTITAAKLVPAIRTQLGLASTAVQNIAEGSTDGTISVDGTDVAVHGLGSAAYTAATAYDASGSAAAVLGTSSDTAATMTVYGVKQYASDVYTAIQALSNNEIDAAITAAEAV